MTQTPALHPFFAQLRSFIVIPTLQALDKAQPGIDVPAARNLVLGVAAQESGGKYLAQFPVGPARGLWEIEPATLHDLEKNFLAYHPTLEAVIVSLMMPAESDEEQLVSNLTYSCAIARLLLYRIKAPLPAATDIRGLGQYWKTYFNTPAGGGTVDEFVANFTNLIGAPPDA
jgi:hypothetical protein